MVSRDFTTEAYAWAIYKLGWPITGTAVTQPTDDPMVLAVYNETVSRFTLLVDLSSAVQPRALLVPRSDYETAPKPILDAFYDGTFTDPDKLSAVWLVNKGLARGPIKL